MLCRELIPHPHTAAPPAPFFPLQVVRNANELEHYLASHVNQCLATRKALPDVRWRLVERLTPLLLDLVDKRVRLMCLQACAPAGPHACMLQ